MLHVDDGQLHAYLDGELALLDAAGAAEIERHLASCAECRARLEEERATRERAHAILRGSGPVGLSEPAFEALAARTAAAVPPRSASRRVRPAAALAWAASIVLALGLGWFGRELLLRPSELQVAAEATSADAASLPETRAAEAAESDTRPLAAAAPPQVETPAQSDAAAPTAAAQSTPPARLPEPRAAAVARGRVIGESGAGIPNVQVYIPAANAGTLTRADGSYTLQVPAGHIPPSGELAIRATVIGMQTATQQVVLKPGEEVAQDFELRPATLALEEIVVTGGARPTLERQAPQPTARAAALAAAAGEVRWEPVEHREAERRLGGRLRLVPGPRVVAIAATVEQGATLVRTLQELEGGGTLELLQRREAAGDEAVALARQPARRAQREAAAPVPLAMDAAAAESLTTIEIRRDGYRITARAPLPADSLRALLAQVQ
ncbi:hypothetical protein BH24GEM3_BH24GEM3_19340 [soil metagenome]